MTRRRECFQSGRNSQARLYKEACTSCMLLLGASAEGPSAVLPLSASSAAPPLSSLVYSGTNNPEGLKEKYCMLVAIIV